MKVITGRTKVPVYSGIVRTIFIKRRQSGTLRTPTGTHIRNRP
ncbi:hypothetical protein [Huintestinicola sp.]